MDSPSLGSGLKTLQPAASRMNAGSDSGVEAMPACVTAARMQQARSGRSIDIVAAESAGRAELCRLGGHTPVQTNPRLRWLASQLARLGSTVSRSVSLMPSHL